MKSLQAETHALLSPSSAHRWAHCTASTGFIHKLAEAGTLPVEEPNPYAEEGTAAHLIAHKVLKSRDWFDHDFYETPDQEEALPIYVNYINDISIKYPSLKWLFEQRVNPARFVKTEHCKGTADAVGISTKYRIVYVVDYKHGEHVVVEIEDNLQVILYALGALAKLIKQGHNDLRSYKIVLAIVQPRAFHQDGKIREWVVSYKELMRWARWLAKRAVLALGDNGVFDPNPDYQCRFCPAQGCCRALAEYELRIAREVFTAVIDKDPVYKDPNRLTRKEISHLLDEIPALKRWTTKISQYALATLEAGARIPYWGLKDSKGFREWNADVDELEMYFDDDVLYENKLRSPAQVEKLAGKGSVNGFTKREVKGHTIYKTQDPSDSDETLPFDEVD